MPMSTKPESTMNVDDYIEFVGIVERFAENRSVHVVKYCAAMLVVYAKNVNSEKTVLDMDGFGRVTIEPERSQST